MFEALWMHCVNWFDGKYKMSKAKQKQNIALKRTMTDICENVQNQGDAMDKICDVMKEPSSKTMMVWDKKFRS